jgi:hypothetical protein
MTRQTRTIRVRRRGVVLLVVLLLTGCGEPAGRHARTVAATGSTITASAPGIDGGSPVSPAPAPVASPAGERAALGAVGVARAFTAAICPYSWRDRVPYGSRLNTALARWGTPAFAAARRWSPARTATAAAGLATRRAQQSCGQVTGGLDPEADLGGGALAVRLSVTVTAQARGSAASSAQQVFDYRLVGQGNGWLISSGHW